MCRLCFRLMNWRHGLMYKRCIMSFYLDKLLRMWSSRPGRGKMSVIGITSAETNRAASSCPQKNCEGRQASGVQWSQGNGTWHTPAHSHCQMPALGWKLTYHLNSREVTIQWHRRTKGILNLNPPHFWDDDFPHTNFCSLSGLHHSLRLGELMALSSHRADFSAGRRALNYRS
jgi:hypothetical protein